MGRRMKDVGEVRENALGRGLGPKRRQEFQL